MKKRKTTGSSMIIVIAIFGILSILGISMLATTTASYKLRIEEGNRMKNLYAAESGIDKAYIKMTEVIQSALNEGIKAVAAEIEANSGTDKELGDINEIYRANFMKYIKRDLVLKFDTEWKQLDIEGGKKADIKCTTTEVRDKNGNIVKADETLYLNGKGSGEKVTYGDRIVTLQSTYESPSTKKQRTISVSYTLSIPDYYRIETSKGEDVSNIINYCLASDGNLEIKDSNSLNISGDVWIKGNIKSETVQQDLLTAKYAGGINIRNSKVNFSGDVNTAHNVNLNDGQVSLVSNKTDDAGKIIDTNIFAENISLSSTDINKDSKFEGSNSSMYLANDLVIDSSNAQAKIKNFYGFNDITTENSESVLINRGVATRGSSSIIVNSENWPSTKGNLDVTDKAYIMGSAYIKTETPYQTGESVALKGNYKVYAMQNEGVLDKYQYEYINPLMLVTRNSQGELLTIEEKAEFFANNSNDVDIRKSGIKLPAETYSVGAYISTNIDGSENVFKPTTTLESQAVNSLTYKTEYVKSVYHMKDKNYKPENSDYDINKDFLDGTAKKSVENQINWDGVNKLIAIRGNVVELDGITFILNNDNNKEVRVYDNSIFLGDLLVEENIITNMKNGVKYIVVSTSDVNFNSKSNFNGSIFSKGDIKIEDVTKENGTQVDLGMTPLTEDDLNSKFNVGVLDLIFTIGERSEGNMIIQVENLISKEKWKLIK